MNNKKIAIVGSGLIGRSWAMLFASGGYNVVIYDSIPDQVTSALRSVEEQMKTFQLQGLLKGKLTLPEQLKLISGAQRLDDCVKDAVHIQECIPDAVDLKAAIFQKLDALVPANVPLASSSSTIPASRFTETLSHRQRCIVAHPINPPYLMPLVELVPAPWTAPQILEQVRSLMVEISMVPITLKKEIQGFIQPRLQYAIIMECLRLVGDGVISVEDVDKILTDGLGTRYAFVGPFEAAHLNAEGFRSYMERYADMIYRIASSEGPAVSMKPDDPRMKQIYEELCQKVPVDKLEERRAWRDTRIAALVKMRNDISQNEK